jgi:Photosynthetic reaction centre cytochrome C subunit
VPLSPWKLVTIAVGATMFVFSTASVAQAPAPMAHMHPANPKPVNLKVLPKDINPDTLHEMMHGYSNDLGVKCGYCHADAASGTGTDFASDAKPEKAIARYMIAMTENINANYLAKAMPGDAKAKATCGTCHRGSAQPAPFVPSAHDTGH